MLRRANDDQKKPQDRGNLEKIAAECDICQRNMNAPGRFKVSLPPDDIVLNKVVCMDIKSLGGKRVLHIVDRDTEFNAAEFLQNKTAEETWNVYMRAWVTSLIGYSDEIHAYQGPQFRAKECKTFAGMAGIKLTLSDVERHNSLGMGERYHEYLRKTYMKVRDEFLTVATEFSLKLAVQAMNDTAGQNGLVPTLLVFVVMPRIPVARKDVPGMVERMKALQSARGEMAKRMAQNRLKTALRSNVPEAADKEVAIGSKVSVYKENPINKWVGPFEVRDVDQKGVFLDISGRMSQLSIDKVKKYVPPVATEDMVTKQTKEGTFGEAEPNSIPVHGGVTKPTMNSGPFGDLDPLLSLDGTII